MPYESGLRRLLLEKGDGVYRPGLAVRGADEQPWRVRKCGSLHPIMMMSLDHNSFSDFKQQVRLTKDGVSILMPGEAFVIGAAFTGANHAASR